MQVTELEALPTLDWEESVRLAGHKKELAKDLLTMLMKELRTELATIKSLEQSQDHPEMLKIVHKLHGAVCYTGTPRLKLVLSALETQLKTNIMDSPSSLLEQLEDEVNRLFEHLTEENNPLK